MTFRQIIRPGDTDNIPPHEHDGSEVSGNATFLKLRASALTAGTIIGQLLQSDYLTLVAQNDTDEGGELAMLGAGAFADWFVDVFEDVWRVRDGANVRFQINDDGTVAIIVGPLVFPSTADGSAASPAIRRNDTADGLFFASGVLAVSIAGAEVARFTAAGIERAQEPAYLLKETVYYTANATWTKADYPGIRAVRVRAQAGGGAGGGAAITAAGEASAGGGGGGGGYAESFVLAADLDTTEAVTAGAGGTANDGASGGAGADSVFDTISGEVRAVGGAGGVTLAASANSGLIPGGAGGSANTGDLDVGGSAGGTGLRLQPSGTGGPGGASHLGGGGAGGGNAAGAGGRIYGGGGGGAGSNQSTGAARLGGAGGAGVVVVEVFV